MVLKLFLMSLALAATTFTAGILPLSCSFSRNHLERLNVLSIGLLLGTALGVIIPEGIEAVAHANLNELPTKTIAFFLLLGFLIMLFVEEVIAPQGSHSHSSAALPALSTPANVVEFDAEMADLDKTSTSARDSPTSSKAIQGFVDREKAFSLLLGLTIHAAADGIALGAANLEKAGETAALSFVVFFALAVHKAPTSLAFTTSLLSTGLPRPECRKYLLIFCSSTPFAAFASYMLFSWLGEGNEANIAGVALLLSGGTFLYIATVIQPVSKHEVGMGEFSSLSRVLTIAVGMFIPLVLSSFFGHEH